MLSKDERLGVSRGFEHGQSGLDVVNALNHNYRLLSVFLQATVKSASIVSEPLLANRKDGDAYIIPTNAIEAWQPHAGKIAQWDASNSSWFYITVRKGFSFFVEDVDKHMIYTAAGWKRVAFEP